VIGYMGSMLVLFSDFFIKRYILKKQAYDMCGTSPIGPPFRRQPLVWCSQS
jgi:hypothetical protein